MPDKSAEIKASPPHVVFITAHAEPIWPDPTDFDIEAFCARMSANGFPIWPTASILFVYTGEDG